jgi:transmembrane sensor
LKQVALNDGTTVDLNTNTALETRLSGARRDIRLMRGEALFHVAHDSTRPFYVTAGTTIVRAVGTSFSVRIRDSDHVDVLVAEGRVAVGPPSTHDLDRPTLFPTASTVGAGESASVQGGSLAVKRLLQQEVNRKLAWTARHLAFRGETLEAAVEEFNRYNQRQLTIGDGSIREVRVGGIFMTTDPQSFMAALRRPFGIRAVTPQTTAAQRNGDIRLMTEDGPPQ